MRVADYVIEFLENQGVDHIFTVSGGGRSSSVMPSGGEEDEICRLPS